MVAMVIGCLFTPVGWSASQSMEVPHSSRSHFECAQLCQQSALFLLSNSQNDPPKPANRSIDRSPRKVIHKAIRPFAWRGQIDEFRLWADNQLSTGCGGHRMVNVKTRHEEGLKVSTSFWVQTNFIITGPTPPEVLKNVYINIKWDILCKHRQGGKLHFYISNYIFIQMSKHSKTWNELALTFFNFENADLLKWHQFSFS